MKTRRVVKAKAKKSITRKKYKGGFYPSVYAGVSTAAYLAPFAAKQAYRFWNSRKNRKSHTHTRRNRK